MSYEEFVRAVKTEVEKLVGSDMRVDLHTAMKNNGKERSGFVIKEEGNNIAPAIYLDEYYEEWKEGITISEVARKVIKLYHQVSYQKPWDVSEFHLYDSIKSDLACKFINYEKNKKMLEDTPHVKYLDLAIVFYLLVEFSEYGKSSMLVREEHKTMWGVTTEQLYKDAMLNVEKLLPAAFQTLNVVIQEVLQEEIKANIKDVRKDANMYVLTNKEKYFGAICLLYKEKLKEIGELLGKNFYIIPSSIHEVLIVTEDKVAKREELDTVIREVNQTQVIEEEVLSDHAYYYNCKKGEILY